MVVGSVGDDPVNVPIGTRVELRDYLAPAVVWRTGRAARVDEDVWSSVSDPVAEGRGAGNPIGGGEPDVRRRPPVGRGYRVTRREPFPCRRRRPDGGLHRAPATAAQTPRAGPRPAASRARIVTAADEHLVQIERELHDAPKSAWGSVARPGASALARSLVPAGGLRAGDWNSAGSRTSSIGVGGGSARDRPRHPSGDLVRGRPGPALRTLARRAAITVELDVPAIGRLPEPIEVAAYYVVSEALTNATRHAHASVRRGQTRQSRAARCGCACATTAPAAPIRLRGSGLVGLKDRIEALGGTFSVHSPAGGGTTVSCELPVLAGAAQPDADSGE